MKMAVITVIAMTREMGSLGRDVATGISERLSMKLVHQELVEKTVRDIGWAARQKYSAEEKIRIVL